MKMLKKMYNIKLTFLSYMLLITTDAPEVHISLEEPSNIVLDKGEPWSQKG